MNKTLNFYKLIKELAGTYHENLKLRPESDFTLEGNNALVEVWCRWQIDTISSEPLVTDRQLAVADFQSHFDQYMTGSEGSDIRSAEDLAAWNRAHADVALPPKFLSQSLIEGSIAYDARSNKRSKYLEHLVEVGKSFEAALERHDINVVIGPGDSRFCNYSAATG